MKVMANEALLSPLILASDYGKPTTPAHALMLI